MAKLTQSVGHNLLTRHISIVKLNSYEYLQILLGPVPLVPLPMLIIVGLLWILSFALYYKKVIKYLFLQNSMQPQIEQNVLNSTDNATIIVQMIISVYPPVL